MSAPRFDRRGFLATAAGGGEHAAVSADTAGSGAGAASHDPFITDTYSAGQDAFAIGRRRVDTDRDQAPLGANDFMMTDWHVRADHLGHCNESRLSTA